MTDQAKRALRATGFWKSKSERLYITGQRVQEPKPEWKKRFGYVMLLLSLSFQGFAPDNFMVIASTARFLEESTA
jgi:hypothetical protein